MTPHRIRLNIGKTKSEDIMTQDHRILAVREGSVEPATVKVCIEDTITLALNGTPLTTLKITPCDLDSFAIGFLVCEGLVSDPSGITAVHLDPPLISVEVESSFCNDGLNSIEVRSAGIGFGSKQGTTGPPLGTGITIGKKILFEGIQQVHDTAPVWRSTGGTHCTILVDSGGHIRSAAEDIGRHNSVDKAVGKAILSGIKPGECFMVCTGRLPADMVAKAYHAGISIVVSNNAPFSSGISLAERMNMTLVGFARPPRMSIYTHPERIRM